MAIIGFETDKSEKVENYMKEVHERLQSENMVKNPFVGGAYKIPADKDKLAYCVIMEPVYPQLFWLGLLSFSATLILVGFRWSNWMIPSLLFFSVGILWTPWFIRFFLRKGLKNVIRITNCKQISQNCIIKRLVSS